MLEVIAFKRDIEVQVTLPRSVLGKGALSCVYKLRAQEELFSSLVVVSLYMEPRSC